MTKPTAEDCIAYLNNPNFTEAEVTDALASESAAQSRVCRVPVPTVEVPDPEWPADLSAALVRRVARALNTRAIPLGYQATIATDGGTSAIRLGWDYEIKRYEAPHRKLVCG